MQKKKAYVEVRSQSRPKFGPDTYVAVQVVPEGAVRLKVLNYKIAKKRNIEIIHCGEGYWKSQGPGTRLGKALQRAEKLAQEINEKYSGIPLRHHITWIK